MVDMGEIEAGVILRADVGNTVVLDELKILVVTFPLPPLDAIVKVDVEPV